MTEVQILASTKQGRIWTAVAVVFLCGLLVGIVATKAYDDYQQQQKWENGLAGLKPRLIKHLTRELHLTAEQQRAIEPILTQAERELLRLRLAQQPQVAVNIAKTTEALKHQLTPQQQSKLDELAGKLQRRWDSDRAYVRGLQ